MSAISAYSTSPGVEDTSRNDKAPEMQPSAISGEWHIETLKSLADIRRNAFRWIELEEQSEDPQAVFQSFAWCEAWAEVYCKTSDNAYEPRIFFISRADTLIAILPMMVETHMGARVLTLFGEPHSQIANVLTRRNSDTSDGLKLCMAQAALLAGADVMALGPIPEGSPLLTASDPQHQSADPAENITLCQWPNDETVETYLKSQSRNIRKNFKRRSRLIAEEGETRFQQFTPLDDEFKSFVKLALAWKRDWLKRSGAFSLGLSMSGVDSFLSGFSGRDTVFQPVLDVLYLNDQPISISINMVGHGIRHCYLSAYNHEFGDLSPGTLATHISIHNSIKSGETGYSFLGFPTPYKAVWSNKHIPLLRYHNALTLRGKIWLLVWIRNARPLAKRMLMFMRKAAQWPIVGNLLNEFLKLLSKRGRNS